MKSILIIGVSMIAFDVYDVVFGLRIIGGGAVEGGMSVAVIAVKIDFMALWI